MSGDTSDSSDDSDGKSNKHQTVKHQITNGKSHLCTFLEEFIVILKTTWVIRQVGN